MHTDLKSKICDSLVHLVGSIDKKFSFCFALFYGALTNKNHRIKEMPLGTTPKA